MSESLFVSVVIPTYNRMEMLKKNLEAFAAQTLPRDRFEVIVVDDGSSDGTRSYLGSEKSTFTLRVFKQDHGGAAKARNLGIRESRGDLIVFTDDDCVVSPLFLELHVEAHQVDGIVGRGPVILVRSMESLPAPEQGFDPAHFSMNFFCTSNASVKKEALIEAGSFDEGFGRWEDAELGYRLRKLGLKMSFLARAPVFHLKPVWTLGNLVKTAISDGKGASRLYRTHPSIRTWFSSGLHPLSVAAGKILKPWVDRKTAAMHPEDPVNGIWERLIFHAYFVKGLSEAK